MKSPMKPIRKTAKPVAKAPMPIRRSRYFHRGIGLPWRSRGGPPLPPFLPPPLPAPRVDVVPDVGRVLFVEVAPVVGRVLEVEVVPVVGLLLPVEDASSYARKPLARDSTARGSIEPGLVSRPAGC